MTTHQNPDSPSTEALPVSRLSPGNPMLSFPHIRHDPYLLACSEQETLKLRRLKTELADHNKEMADRAEWLWDEMHREKAERLATRLHSKKPGPVATGLRLSSYGTDLLLREFMAIRQMIQNRGDCLMGIDREEALNLVGLGGNCRLIHWEWDATPDEMRKEQRAALWTKFVDEATATLEGRLPHLLRIEAAQRQRIMSGQPAPDDKVANRLQREINAAERKLFRLWTEAKKLEKQQGFKKGNPALSHSDYEANPIPETGEDPRPLPDYERNPNPTVTSDVDSVALPDYETNPIPEVTSEVSPSTTPDYGTNPIPGADQTSTTASVATCGTEPKSGPKVTVTPVRRGKIQAKPFGVARELTRTGEPCPVEFAPNPPKEPRSPVTNRKCDERL